MSETHHKQNLRTGPAVGTLLVPGPTGTIGPKVIVQEKRLRTRPCPFLGIHGFTTFLKVRFHDFLMLFFFIKNIYLFIAAMGLHCCTQAFSSCSEGGSSSLGCAGFSLQWVLLLWSTGSRAAGFTVYGAWVQQLQPEGSKVWLRRCGTRLCASCPCGK